MYLKSSPFHHWNISCLRRLHSPQSQAQNGMRKVNPSTNQNISDFCTSRVWKKNFGFGPKRHANDTFCKGSQFGTLYEKGCWFVAPVYIKGCQFEAPFRKGCQIETPRWYPMTRNDTHQLPPFYPKSNVQVEALCSLLKAGSWETAGTWGVPSRIKAWIPKSNPNTTITSCNVPTRTTYKLNWWIHYLWSGKLPRCVPFCTLSVSSARDWAARSSHLQSLLIHWISVNSVLRWGGT